MSTIKTLNNNIQLKNKKIKQIYPNLNKVRVYFQVRVYHKETFEIVYESKEFKNHTKQLDKLMAEAVNEYNDEYVKQLVRFQTSGYVGGIIMSGYRDIIQNIAC